ncbi:alpha/beta fold hydrolase [Larsenimonas rhizosphaerae]|uniref:Alpha/beta hydrolase n=1 Tax=Larsenimonas rhizosphaerae TaxID=2944682 RepID=A0AA42CT12_9GAMM|nr:alpha/beta hydrolase [Larsenimonas rhizosphaerae]MCX2522664.1 alpha/beta hydrolase [Larsenimonas rhizosphaerae]
MTGFSDKLTALFDNNPLIKTSDIDQDTLVRRYGHPDSRYASLPDGNRVHYLISGPDDAPVIVLIHGLTMDNAVWETWRPVLAEQYRVIVLDLPGHGLSTAAPRWQADIPHHVEVVHQTLNQLTEAPFTLIGHSMGGWISWLYTLTHPNRVTALGLVAAAGWTDQRRQARTAQSFMNFAGNAVGRTILRYANGDRFIEEGMKATFSPDAPSEDMIRRYQDMLHGPGHRETLLSLAKHWEGSPKADDTDFTAITCPVLIISGDCDGLIPTAHAYAFERKLNNPTLIMYPRTGHVPMLGCHPQCLDDTRRWLDEAVPASEVPATSP